MGPRKRFSIDMTDDDYSNCTQPLLESDLGFDSSIVIFAQIQDALKKLWGTGVEHWPLRARWISRPCQESTSVAVERVRMNMYEHVNKIIVGFFDFSIGRSYTHSQKPIFSETSTYWCATNRHAFLFFCFFPDEGCAVDGGVRVDSRPNAFSIWAVGTRIFS